MTCRTRGAERRKSTPFASYSRSDPRPPSRVSPRGILRHRLANGQSAHIFPIVTRLARVRDSRDRRFITDIKLRPRGDLWGIGIPSSSPSDRKRERERAWSHGGMTNAVDLFSPSRVSPGRRLSSPAGDSHELLSLKIEVSLADTRTFSAARKRGQRDDRIFLAVGRNV